MHAAQKTSFFFYIITVCMLSAFSEIRPAPFIRIESYDHAKQSELTITGNTDLAEARLSPASTFKVPLAIAALQSGVIQPSSAFMIQDPYITEKPRYANLREAMYRSSNDYFIKVYRLLGRDEVVRYLNESGPGYENLSSLPAVAGPPAAHGGGIKITPVNQHRWMQRLASGSMTGSEKLQEQVLEILSWPAPPKCKLYGKTGSWDQTLWFSGFGRCSKKGPYRVVTIVRRQYYTKERRMAVIAEFYKSFGLNPPDL